MPLEEAVAQVERINRWAFVGELCIHDDSSGVNNTISSRGKAVLFRSNASDQSSVIPLVNFPKLRFLLVNTKQPRSTATQVERVRTQKEKLPEVIEPILKAISELTSSALELSPLPTPT